MKQESVIFPNPNQLITLRALQTALCGAINARHKAVLAVPALPLCIRSEALASGAECRISGAEAQTLATEGSGIFLSIALKINGQRESGRIELCNVCGLIERIDSKSMLSEVKDEIEREFVPKLKKISPFRLVRLETEEYKNGRTWSITREKWGKF